MSWFERKFGKYAIPNISLLLILCYGCGYVIQFINASFLQYLTLNPYAILHGQIWRLVSWIIVPPSQSNIFFVLITLYFYYSIGSSLERTWGTYRYNVYLFSGMLFTVLGSFAMMAYFYIRYTVIPPEFFSIAAGYFTTYYVNMSIFLAFAATFPDVQVLLMFILPIKVKVLGIIYAIMLVAGMFTGNVCDRFAICASLLNFVVFYLMSRNRFHMTPKQMKRHMEYKRKARQASKRSNMQYRSANGQISKHKCAICGRTEMDDENLEFRFCSKCNGNYEYCQYHLFTHTHVK
ncbi:MAG: hypothetical protein Q4B72_03990 [Lachnospiraceae bacterium]|nr:hypothetical protein [Lachnospiraceae bacterium]